MDKMEVGTAKVVSMLTLGLGSFLAGVIPACFSERARQRIPLFLSCLLCFGGGVLLSTSIIHMLPEAREKLPGAELMFCVGFFIVFLVDELVHLINGSSSTASGHESPSYGSNEETRLLHDDEMRERNCEGSRLCHVGHVEPCNRSASGIIGLLCALFVHSLLEGLAIGLQETSTQVFLLLAAVSSHKFVVGFCLGTELCSTYPRRVCMFITCITIFSAGSVVGIGAGAGLETLRTFQNSTAVPVMQALAAGTLLYVTVSEVLPRERARWHERRRAAGLAQFVAVALGFSVMYVTTKYLDHDAA